ncbi:hypothetical protein FB107DRAFT_280168 [Schizophyllum commune]
MTSPSTFAFAIDLCLSQSTYAFCIRPPPFSADLRLMQSTYRLRHTLTSSPFDRLRPSGARSCPRQIAASSASKVEFSSASKDLRGKHNARRRFLGSFSPEDDDHRILRGKYKRREGKVTQVYRKKWVINCLLASITRPSRSPLAARYHYRRSLVASIHPSPAAAKHYAAKVAREARINL